MRSAVMPHHSPNGFTLVEVIVTILIGAIVGSLVISQLGTSLLHSGESVWTVRNEAQAEACMESIISDYVKAMNSNYATALATVQAKYSTIVAPCSTIPDMRYVKYTCNSATGICSESYPATSTNLKVSVRLGTAKRTELTSLLTAERSSASDPYVTY